MESVKNNFDLFWGQIRPEKGFFGAFWHVKSVYMHFNNFPKIQEQD